MNIIIRLVFLVLLVLSFASVAAQAQQVSGYVEYEHVVVSSDDTPEINVYAHGPLHGKLGWTAWTLTTRPWTEALVGLTYAPAKWVEVSGNVGTETADDPTRYAGSVWLGKGRFSFLSFVEDGGSGEWHKNTGTFQATKNFALGVLNQRYVGTGPYAEVKFGKITGWGSWVGGKSGLFGGRFNF